MSMPGLPRRRAANALALAATAAALLPSSAAAARAPIRDCGDTATHGAGAFAITAQGRGLTCKTARGVARQTPLTASCKSARVTSCTVRGFVCLVARVGEELWLARCEASNETKFVRFEFGS
jgi:hypothetical protein